MSGRKVLSLVMAGLDPAIDECREQIKQDVDARHKAGHDEGAGGARQS
ncbi:hypothetical protein [Bradyrhizobium sp. S69]|jgi:hypothetical protein|nr:hypothetical protein [Bradyrhizobium sp. S69]